MVPLSGVLTRGLLCGLLFGSRPLRELADDRQNVRLVVAGFDHHEDRNREEESVQKRIQREVVVGAPT